MSMKTSLAMAAGTASVLTAGVVAAQNGNMMNGGGGMWSGGWMDGYGGIWWPLLLVAVVVGIAILIMQRKGK